MSRSWGTGSSTSDAEAKAAATTGSSINSLPVNFSLPSDVHATWVQSSVRPGISLLGADLRPSLMVSNVRATIFPHLQQQVQATMALSMTRQAWSEIEQYEELHKWKCGERKPVLKMVQPVQEEGQEMRRQSATVSAAEQAREAAAATSSSSPSSSSAASSSSASPPPSSSSSSAYFHQHQFEVPPITRTEAFLSRVWSGQYKFPLSSSTAASPPPTPASPFDPPPPPPKRFLSSERWLVERCDGTRVYRVQYYGEGDHFWAQIVPTTLGGCAQLAYRRFKEMMAPPS